MLRSGGDDEARVGMVNSLIAAVSSYSESNLDAYRPVADQPQASCGDSTCLGLWVRRVSLVAMPWTEDRCYIGDMPGRRRLGLLCDCLLSVGDGDGTC